jgi:hypothetical protein
MCGRPSGCWIHILFLIDSLQTQLRVWDSSFHIYMFILSISCLCVPAVPDNGSGFV